MTVLFVACPILKVVGQEISLNDGMYSAEWTAERDAIALGVENRRKLMNGGYEDLFKNRDYDLEKRLKDAVNRQNRASNTSGLQIEYSTPTQSRGTSTSRTTYSQSEQMKKARDAAAHQQWLEKKRIASEAAAERRRLEEQRKREEQERRYQREYTRQMQQLERQYDQKHAKVEYQAHEGFYNMMNYQPEGTEIMESQYIPSTRTTSQADVGSIISKSKRNAQHVIRLNGDEHYKSTSSWDEAMSRMFAEDMKTLEERMKAVPEYKSYSGEVYDQIREKLDDVQRRELAFYLKLFNTKEIVEEKEDGDVIKQVGAFPEAIGTTSTGQYVFESEDGKRVFRLSENCQHLQILTFDEHFFKDENIIAQIKKDGLKEYLGESFNLNELMPKVEMSLGKNILKEMKDEDIKKIMPKLKTGIKLNLLDNSSKIKYQYVYIAPKEKLSVTYHTFGGSIELLAGGKADVSIGAETDSKATPKLAFKGSAGAKASFFGGGLAVEVGNAAKVGEQYYMCTRKIKLNGDVGFAAKKGSGSLETNVLPLVSLGLETKGYECENITSNVEDMPTKKNL